MSDPVVAQQASLDDARESMRRIALALVAGAGLAETHETICCKRYRDGRKHSKRIKRMCVDAHTDLLDLARKAGL